MRGEGWEGRGESEAIPGVRVEEKVGGEGEGGGLG